jgi:hypothetical protein
MGIKMFKYLPKVEYPLKVGDKVKYKDVVVNLSAAFVLNEIVNDITNVSMYTVPEGARPEDVAFELYRNAEYYWTILLVNDIINPYTDWTLQPYIIEKQLKKKYTDLYKILYYKNTSTGKTLDEVDAAAAIKQFDTTGEYPLNISPVTLYETAMDQNREKANIKVISPGYIEDFVSEFKKAFA